MEDVESAGVNARVESVDSALVGLSDIAELTGMSRQAIALLKDGARPGHLPGPVQRLRGQSRYGTGLRSRPADGNKGGWLHILRWQKMQNYQQMESCITGGGCRGSR